MKLKRDAGSLLQPLPNPRIELTSAELSTLRKASEILGRIVEITEPTTENDSNDWHRTRNVRERTTNIIQRRNGASPT